MKVLVTGATGFIGRYVIENLLQRPEVEVVASGTSTVKAAQQTWFPRVQFAPFAIGSDANEGLMERFGQPDKLIHLAWSGLPNYKKLFHFEDELPRQYAFLKQFIREGLGDVTVSGTCFEYGMQEGQLREDMPANPGNPYALAKDCLRRFLTELQREERFSLKWARLFYMWGEGQSETAILPQLGNALRKGETVFNMSGGEQIRDYLPVESVAENIASIALQNDVTGIINCSSNQPVTINQLVAAYLERVGGSIALNKGFYPYPDYEPFAFYGDNHKLKQHQTPDSMSDPIKAFQEERAGLINSYGTNEELKAAARRFNEVSNRDRYSYNFSWMGRPIIQYPQDMVKMQELIWSIQPDLLIETGIAHGGSLIYYASIMELIGKGEVLGIDIDIRDHNRSEIEAHPMAKRISMIQGSAVDEDIAQQVRERAAGKQTVMVCLDSNHTHEHVLRELELYAPLTTVGSYCVVFDTIVEDMPARMYDRPWDVGNNPKTAVWEYIKANPGFEIDKQIDNQLLISVAPEGYLKRVR